MINSKITHDLLSQLYRGQEDKSIQVIIELTNKLNQLDLKGHTRQEKIANLKEAFTKGLKSVEKVISQKGGQVLDSAWLNQTLRAEIPAHCLDQIAELEEVSAIDIPHTLTPDFK